MCDDSDAVVDELLADWRSQVHRVRAILLARGIRRADWPDVEQSVMVRLLVAARSGNLPDPDPAKRRCWFVAVARNAWLDARRRPRPGTFGGGRSLGLDEEIADPRAVDPAEAAAGREAAALVAAALDRLTRERRQVVDRFRDRRNLRAVADELGIPYTTAVGRFHTACRLVAEALDDRVA